MKAAAIIFAVLVATPILWAQKDKSALKYFEAGYFVLIEGQENQCPVGNAFVTSENGNKWVTIANVHTFSLVSKKGTMKDQGCDISYDESMKTLDSEKSHFFTAVEKAKCKKASDNYESTETLEISEEKETVDKATGNTIAKPLSIEFKRVRTGAGAEAVRCYWEYDGPLE